MTVSEVTLFGLGDIGPIHEPMDAYSSLVRSQLASADLRFAQVERVYSVRGALQLHSGGGHSRVKPNMASVFSDCGVNVASLASNHAMDWGEEALLDTIEVLNARGIRTVGAGANLAEARRPVVLECKGIRIAFLAYCSILHEGYAATSTSAGVAPLRIRTHYEPTDYQAGVPPRIVTTPYEEDLAAMLEDISGARQRADVVILSLHWGVHFVPRLIAEYQPLVAKAAFDAGADLILGHHAHVPKAIEVVDGKVCFYSLSNFIMSSTSKSPNSAAAFERQYGVRLDPDYPNLAYGADAKRSMIAKAVISSGGVQQVAFLPVLIDKQLRPEILRSGDARFQDMVRFMEWVSEGINHRFVVQGDEVHVES